MKLQRAGIGVAASIVALAALYTRDANQTGVNPKPSHPVASSLLDTGRQVALPVLVTSEDQNIQPIDEAALVENEMILKPTEEEMQDILYMRDFLVKYNIKYLNYELIDWAIEGAQDDLPGAIAKCKKRGWAGIADRTYLETMGLKDKLVQARIARETKEEMTRKFKDFRVDPNAKNIPGNKPSRQLESAAELAEYSRCAQTFREIVQRELSSDEEAIFPDGTGLDTVNFFISNNKDGKIRGLPPGVIVDRPKKDGSEKKLASQ